MRTDLPTVVWSGIFRFLGVEIKCHTLSDGQRIVESDSVRAFIEAMNNPASDDPHEKDTIEAFKSWMNGQLP